MPPRDPRGLRALSGGQLAGIGIALSLLAALLFSFQQDARVDEPVHLAQIRRFFGGDFTVEPRLTNIPGFHLLMAGLCQAWDTTALPFVRSVNAAFAGVLIMVFALNMRTIHGSVSLPS